MVAERSRPADVDERTPAPPTELPPSHRDAWAALAPSDRALVTGTTLARWAADLDPDDYQPSDIARLERARQRSLATIRDGVELTDQEWRMVRYLQRHEGRTVRLDELVRHLWGDARRAAPRDLWDRNGPYARHVRHVQRLASTIRAKIEIDPLRPQHMATIRSVGYRWYSAAPSRDDGEDYAARAEDALVARREIRGIRGELPQPRGYHGRFLTGPNHPDSRAIDAAVLKRRTRKHDDDDE